MKYYLEFNNLSRKCCTIFIGESCRTNYNATRTKPFEGGTVYRFPQNPDDRKRWIQSLPNRPLNISKDIHICYKHFPPDCPKNIAPGGALIPKVAPSIFGDTNSNFLIQTVTPTRGPEKCNVTTAESRALTSKARDKVLDTVDSFSNLKKYCSKFSPELYLITM